MRKRRNNSDHASTLQVVLSTGMIFTSAIVLASTPPPHWENAPRQDPSRFQLEEDSDSITALGSYPDTSILLSTDTTVTPDAAPTDTTSINVSTSTNFKGTLAGDPATGVVRVTDAHPAGTYTVTVRAFDGSGPTATTTFMLTVATPVTCIPVSFAAATNYSGGPLPMSVAVGDFNNDGKQDLAVANFGVGPPHPQPGSMSILLGNGTGNFTATSFSTGAHVQTVVVGDFNGDGKQDLAVTNNGSNVLIFLGDGAGNFSAATTFPAVTQPGSVAVGDFNDDGKQDLAVTNNGSNVLIFLGDGTGNFSPPTTFDAGATFGQIVVGDFNEDGKQDLAVTNYSSTYVSILLGDGTGSFSAPTNFGTGPHPVAVAVGDFNGDDKQDLAMTNRDPANVSILLGDGAGNFSEVTHFGADSNPGGIVTGDFDGDGKQDLAVANAPVSSASVSILLGDGVGNFGAPISLGASSGAGSVAVGDFNDDGKQDLATAYPFVSVWLRDCGTAPTPTATAAPSATATATATPPPTPTPCPLFTITGTVGQCTAAGLSGIALPGVTMTRTDGGGSTTTTTDGSGNYEVFALQCSTPYTVTPSKAARSPGSAGINTVDGLAVQRHFLGISLLTGCRLAAADCVSPTGISTIDVLAIQRFFLGLTTGTGNVGRYSFTPANRLYSLIFSNQTAQNYDAIVFGDVASPFAAP